MSNELTQQYTSDPHPGVFICPADALLVAEGSVEAAIAGWSDATVALADEYAARTARAEATR